MPAATFRALAIVPALFALTGCCCFVPAEAETVVVVVPSRHDGHVGAVVATRGEQKELANKARKRRDSGKRKKKNRQTGCG